MSTVKTSAYFKRKMEITNMVDTNLLPEKAMEYFAQQIEEAFSRGQAAAMRHNPDPTGVRDDVTIAIEHGMKDWALPGIYAKSKGYKL